MTHKLIVPDANIFAKLLHPEPDSLEAKVFFKTCVATGARLVVPELFKYEIAEVTRYHKGSLAKTLDLLDAHLNAIMTIASPDRDSWLLAEEITQNGHDKSGFPTIYDSIYHALAIRMDGTFLTADKRHYAKAKSFGHIKLLKDWESVFIDTQ